MWPPCSSCSYFSTVHVALLCCDRPGFQGYAVARRFSHTFAIVILRNRHIHKCISALLLVMLLFIHSIKLLHSHSGTNSFSNHNCNGICFEQNDSSEPAKNSTDCGICSYQLTKDADHIACPAFYDPIIQAPDLNTGLVSYNKFSLPSVLDNRGPPSISLA